MVEPPCMMTVNMTMREVVVSIACRASDIVFLIASAKDIAPRKPRKFHLMNILELNEKQIVCGCVQCNTTNVK